MTVDTAERMIMYFDQRGIVSNSSVLEMISGRKATTTEEQVKSRLRVASGAEWQPMHNFRVTSRRPRVNYVFSGIATLKRPILNGT